jgi:two-component system, cell cycle response regulator
MPTSTIKMLLIEDNPGDVHLIRVALREIAELQFEFSHCETLVQAFAFLANNKPDIILLDLGLPDSQGLETVRRARVAAAEAPLVVLTVLDDSDLAVRSLREGAQDYLVKAQIDGALLWHAMRYAMERQRVQLGLLNLALIDDLTGLSNRRGFFALAEHHMKLAYRTGQPFLVAFVDLDGMKQINDTYGHQEGNRALVDTSNILRDSFRQSDILARMGGDEFATLIADAGEDSIATVIKRVQEKLRCWNEDPNRRYPLSFSIGIVPGDAAQLSHLETLLDRADAVMYEEKESKKIFRSGFVDQGNTRKGSLRRSGLTVDRKGGS